MRLELQELAAGYGKKIILDGVSLEAPEGKILTLLGPNGCGKSTLLKTIGRLLRPRGGAVLLDGKSIHQLDTAKLARDLAILPQLHHAPADLSVRQLVSCGRFPHRKGFGPPGKHDTEVVDHVLEQTRLTGLAHRPLATLSGGERQRAWIAMTLAQEPNLLLLDEPTTFLDICCQFEIIELVRELNRELGITVVMVLHDLNLAARCSHLLAAIRDGKLRYAGSAEEILRPEILREIFEIEAKVVTGADGIPYCIPVGSCRQEEREKERETP